MPVLSLISRETDEHGFVKSEKYITERGLELSICPTPGGLYEIVTHGGGVPPTICGDRFTSHLKAKDELTKYIISTDRLGYAEYPGKPEELKRKAVTPKAKVKSDGPEQS